MNSVVLPATIFLCSHDLFTPKSLFFCPMGQSISVGNFEIAVILS